MQPMLQTFVDPRAFKAAVYPLLLQNEAQNCICLGMIDALINEPERFPEYTLASVALDGRVVGAAWLTPPHPLGMTTLPADTIPAVMEFASGQKVRPFHFLGPVATVEKFIEQWQAATQSRVKRKMAQGIYELIRVNLWRESAGVMRLVDERDLALLAQWNLCFDHECGMGDDAKLARERAGSAIKRQTHYFWEVDGRVVAMAGVGGKTPSGVRVIAVYTPPAERGKGYATTLVARLSQKMLNEGKRFCFLYTDLANPVSNGIYQKIGYRLVGDSAYYSLEY